ncbi:GATOR complex protein Iml1 [Anopheles ziemanni]|uniref:GATOR complex protein Iml1 n=1 Tax=Anopheles ziemanni TaxID=345580 RepID=UPI002658AA93|nr:GATOR complex protein Iml1 isoform X1 [Anopheles coustani]XP_058168367.1 GATOR complex protein Iml1 [Anopheles ziemanni]
MMIQKLFKLVTHQKTFSTEDLVLNPKEHPDLKLNNIVEIYLPEDEGCRLLLQVTCLNKDFNSRETISVEVNVATTFNLKAYNDVYMRVVDPTEVTLDSVEITFKDQYIGRSEMWRLKTRLTNTCVYLNKKIEYCEGCIRCQVYEMWAQGERVACGVINEDTKVVFRSNTSMVYLFVQMSSEMWDFDIYGDLYFEKAVNGFLADLYKKWQKLGSNHEVTIVLFSRTFYAAKGLEEFPAHMRDCLQIDYRGRFYEDFYRVAIQNERCDDWSTTLVQLRRLFTGYRDVVLKYHERADLPNLQIPPATNSTAAQGNFLEVLNISLNVFEKHYLDRSFDRTGQLSVVITPGVGVFEVDRELTNITKQRIIDNGVGSDLVCVGEQPLHAVPLLKFHNKDALTSIDDYSMPHWINLSFYSTNKKIAYSTFVPRIKPPPALGGSTEPQQPRAAGAARLRLPKKPADKKNEYIHNCLFDYDAYDDQIFQLPAVHGTSSLQRMARTKKTSVPSLDGFGTYARTCEWEPETVCQTRLRRKMSDPDIHHTSNSLLNVSVASHSSSPNTSDILGMPKPNLASAAIIEGRAGAFGSSSGPVVRTGRALINPFDPSHVTIKLTSNRRRWTHIFPKGPQGVLIQQHHYQAVPATTQPPNYYVDLDSSSEYAHTSTCTWGRARHGSTASFDSRLNEDDLKWITENGGGRKKSILHSPAGPHVPGTPSKSLTLLWGATGEQEWTSALTTVGKVIIGVDWKSLTIPACLPITTDYFPDKRSLHNDYVVSDYTLLPEDFNADYAQNRAVYKKPLSTDEVFKELVSQRLAQGFQLIVLPDKSATNPPQAPCCGGQLQPQSYFSNAASSVLRRQPPQEPTKEYLLSIGRIFHRISLSGSAITVTRYRPRHPYPPINVDYRYRFHAPQHDTYEVSGVNFTTEKLENFNWNYMDQYICTRGDTDYPLHENMKYWRYRMYLLPKDDPAMKKILDGTVRHCDIYHEDSPFPSDKQICNDFVRFVEAHLNKIKKIQPAKKARGCPRQTHLTRRRHSTSILSRPPPNQHGGWVKMYYNGTASNGHNLHHHHPHHHHTPERFYFPSTLTGNSILTRAGSKVLDKSGSAIQTPPPSTGGSGSGGTTSSSATPTTPTPTTTLPTATTSTTPMMVSSIGGKTTVDGIPLSTLNSAAEQGLPEDTDDFTGESCKLKPTATLQEIFDALRHPVHGVGFLGPAQSMPSCTFVSYDAITWLQNRIEGPCHPVDILEEMRRNRLICHASGDFNKPVVPGFCLYYIARQDKESPEYVPPLGDLAAFENEWMEVEIQHPDLTKPLDAHDRGLPAFLRESLDAEGQDLVDGLLYKQTHLEIDVSGKSDRTEWGHARYHQRMIPGHAYEIVVQWITASGPIVYDLIYGWCRKAQPCGFQLVTIPADPLAEPFTEKSDPLRGPIFIPLDTDCLNQHSSFLFEEFPKESWPRRLLLFQEEIVRRFGFMRCTVETKTGSNQVSLDYQYVHCSGNMFIMVPNPNMGLRSRQRLASGGSNFKKPVHFINRYSASYEAQVAGPGQNGGTTGGSGNAGGGAGHEPSYITRHVTGKGATKDDFDVMRRTGFLWSWNHMIPNKRWKSLVISQTDDLFQLKMLRDFKEFCANADQRLVNFWESCWELKEKASIERT